MLCVLCVCHFIDTSVCTLLSCQLVHWIIFRQSLLRIPCGACSLYDIHIHILHVYISLYVFMLFMGPYRKSASNAYNNVDLLTVIQEGDMEQ